MTANNGGPAFPYPTRYSTDMRTHGGMTLRDYFAAKALQGILSHGHGPAGKWEMAAEHAYKAADAMLALRDK